MLAFIFTLITMFPTCPCETYVEQAYVVDLDECSSIEREDGTYLDEWYGAELCTNGLDTEVSWQP